MKPSVIEPINPAIERTKKVLFQPFDFGKWLRLGFCAFLMSLGEGGGYSGGGHGGGGPGGPGGNADFEPVFEWVRENMTLIVTIAIAVVLFFFVLGLVITWLSSRGRFMFLDGVVRNRGAVVAPWREYRREGNSFFLFRVCLGFAGLAVVLLILGICALVALPDIQDRQFGGSAMAAIGAAIVLFIPFAIVMAFIGTFLNDFVAPIMYLRRITTIEAWREFHRAMLSGRMGTFILYFLFKIVIGIAVGAIAMATMCLTCCIVAIPYVGTVILLPLLVFVQAYPLYFIEQFGPDWKIFDAKPAVSSEGSSL